MKGATCIPALKALGDETRLRTLRLLSAQPQSVTEIAEALKVSPYNVSKHLRIMREAGLLTCQKDGRIRRYGIPPKLRTELERPGGVLDLGCCTFRLDQLPK